MSLPPASNEVALSLAVKLPLWSAILAELLGVPLAWFRLRKADAWIHRPKSVRRIDLLAKFVGKITVLAAVLGGFVAFGAILMGGA